MIDSYFDSEIAGPVQDSPRWALGDGAASGLIFVDAGGGDIQVGVEVGSSVCVHETSPPNFPHQRVEVQVKFSTTTPSQAFSGGVLRYIDQDNMIYFFVDHNTKEVKVAERLAAAESVLLSLSAADAVGGCSIAVEAIGRRIRLWVEPGQRAVADRPPDAGANLSSEGDEESPGGWGLFMRADGTNDMRIIRFQARDLPSAASPAPSFAVSDAASADLALVPISAVASGVSGSALALEWEVYPADPDDYPEAYCDQTIPSVTSRIFFVRPGFTYDVRVREITAVGMGKWSAFNRITAAGTRIAPPAEILPSTQFPNAPADYVMPLASQAAVAAVVSETGRERVTSPILRPRLAFKLSYQNRQGALIQELIDFFDDMRGKRQSFRWTHPTTGRSYAMRFDSDDYEIEYGDRGEAGIIASFELQIAEVWLGSVGTLSATLALDAELT